MNVQKKNTGLTLVEMLLTVTIVAILATIVITTVVRIDARNKENLTAGLMRTINAALSEFRDYGFAYKRNTTDPCELAFYRSLDFPPDCNGYTVSQIEAEIEELLGLDPGEVIISGYTDHNDLSYSGCEVMYFFLWKVPTSRAVLSNIDKSFLTNTDRDNQEMTIRIKDRDSRTNPWMRIIDPWGTTLNYDYYVNEQVENNSLNYEERAETIRSFPLITSAGPDKKFGTDDDIYNREKTEATKKLP